MCPTMCISSKGTNSNLKLSFNVSLLFNYSIIVTTCTSIEANDCSYSLHVSGRLLDIQKKGGRYMYQSSSILTVHVFTSNV